MSQAPSTSVFFPLNADTLLTSSTFYIRLKLIISFHVFFSRGSMKNDPWFQFTLNNWSPPDQSLPFLKMLLHPSMYFSMSPTTFFILSDSRKYLYFVQVLPCSKHLLIELSTKNSFSQSCQTTYLHDIEWKAAQLKFNCLPGQSKICCTNEFSYMINLSDLPLVNFHELSRRLV